MHYKKFIIFVIFSLSLQAMDYEEYMNDRINLSPDLTAIEENFISSLLSNVDAQETFTQDSHISQADFSVEKEKNQSDKKEESNRETQNASIKAEFDKLKKYLKPIIEATKEKTFFLGKNQQSPVIIDDTCTQKIKSNQTTSIVAEEDKTTQSTQPTLSKEKLSSKKKFFGFKCDEIGCKWFKIEKKIKPSHLLYNHLIVYHKKCPNCRRFFNDKQLLYNHLPACKSTFKEDWIESSDESTLAQLLTDITDISVQVAVPIQMEKNKEESDSDAQNELIKTAFNKLEPYLKPSEANVCKECSLSLKDEKDRKRHEFLVHGIHARNSIRHHFKKKYKHVSQSRCNINNCSWSSGNKQYEPYEFCLHLLNFHSMCPICRTSFNNSNNRQHLARCINNSPGNLCAQYLKQILMKELTQLSHQ